MGKHVHAEIIHAWADGAEVQVLRQEFDGDFWEDAARPRFNPDVQYRVKLTEKVVRWLWAFKYSGAWYTHNQYLTDVESEKWFEEHEATSSKKLEWSRQEFDE